MRAAGDGPDGVRLRGVIVVLWRAGLRVQRQLGHADLGSQYLRGIDNTEIVHAVHERPAPMIPAVNGLRFTH